MPVTPTYPGVYVEEITSPVHPITGVSTSITAFIGEAPRGPVGRACECLGYADYARQFGGFDADSEMSYAVYQFFANGGSNAQVIRVAAKPTGASLALKSGGTNVIQFSSAFLGQSANFISVAVTAGSDGASFNLVVKFLDPSDPADAVTEVFNAVSMDQKDASYVQSVINDPDTGSKLVTVKAVIYGTGAPALSGLKPATLSSTSLLLGTMPVDPSLMLLPGSDNLTVKVNSLAVDFSSLLTNTAYQAATKPADRLTALCKIIQDGVVAKAGADLILKGFTCKFDAASNSIVMAAGNATTASQIFVSGPAASALGLGSNYGGTSVPSVAQLNPDVTVTPAYLAGGSEIAMDPTKPADYFAGFIGNPTARTGLYALEEIDLFNILCVPGITDASIPAAPAILAAAAAYCEQRRAFLIVDSPAPQDGTPTSPTTMKAAVSGGPMLPKSDHAAVYYPWVKLPDPLHGGRNRLTAPCGIVAGIFARTDNNRGVWKAPAGIEATIPGATGLEYRLSDAENGDLNPLGVNCLRSFPVYGNIVWGARTLRGADVFASDYKYVPVRRFALFLEESLFRGLKWVVFEPNDEPLWSAIRLNVGAFMHDLFVQGAFEGSSPRDAYRVQCDSSTTSQNDIDKGIVNIIVAFAPLKPAEFVVLQIQQLAGQIQT